MTAQKLSKPPTWSLKPGSEKDGCELTVEFFTNDGSKHVAGYCFLSEKECVNWIIHELIMRAKGGKCATDSDSVEEEVKLYERLLKAAVEMFEEKGITLF